MMESIKRKSIKERIWRLDDEPDFTRAIYIDSGWLYDHIDLSEYQTGHAIYLDSKKPEILIGFIFRTTESDVGYFNSFLDYLRKFDLTNFMDILLAIDTYTLTNLYSKIKISNLNFTFKNHPIIDSFLKESRGALIWHHQLENLYLFHLNNKDEATDFRKNILKKLASAFDLAFKIQIDQEITLNDVINDRMVFGGTIIPSLREASKLFHLMNCGSKG